MCIGIKRDKYGELTWRAGENVAQRVVNWFVDRIASDVAVDAGLWILSFQDRQSS